jgi:hypothetical protein
LRHPQVQASIYSDLNSAWVAEKPTPIGGPETSPIG